VSCAFVACNNDENEEVEKSKPNNDDYLLLANTYQGETVAEQRQKAIDEIEKLNQVFLTRNVGIDYKCFPENTSNSYLPKNESEQRKIINEIVSTIYLYFHNALQNGKTLNYEAIYKYNERLKNAESRCLFIIELFNLANYLQIDGNLITKWQNYFPCEFSFKDLLDTYGWWVSKFDFKSDLIKDSNESYIEWSVEFLDEKHPCGYVYRSYKLDNMEDPINNVDQRNYITKLKSAFQTQQTYLKKYIEQPSDENFKFLENFFEGIKRN
jgi:hypothetical protein